MDFLKKVWATLANTQQRPDPSVANEDLRRETAKNMNQEHEREAEDRQDMLGEERQVPNPIGPSDSEIEA